MSENKKTRDIVKTLTYATTMSPSRSFISKVSASLGESTQARANLRPALGGNLVSCLERGEQIDDEAEKERKQTLGS